jgi:predicted lipoprotein with Yx(FWY)xxD motif
MSDSSLLLRKRWYVFAVLLVVALLGLSACQTEPAAMTAETPAPEMEREDEQVPLDPMEVSPTPEMEEVGEAQLSVMDTAEFGEILVGNEGMTLYIFTIDGPNQSNCDAACLALWPPLLTDGNPILGEGIDANLVGSAEMADGSQIVTYNQKPLYFWVHDREPGDTTGQGVEGIWFVVSPQGNLIGLNERDEVSEEASMQEDAVVTADLHIQVAQNTPFGDILVDGQGMTLYMFTMDEQDLSTCRGDCLNLWPPLVIEGEPVLGEGLDADLIGSAELEDGRMMVTYNGIPLYYYAFDNEPGDLNGQGVGGIWFVVSPMGEEVREEVESDEEEAVLPPIYDDPDY